MWLFPNKLFLSEAIDGAQSVKTRKLREEIEVRGFRSGSRTGGEQRQWDRLARWWVQ